MASLSYLDEESLMLLRLRGTKPSLWVRLNFLILAPKKGRHLNQKGNAKMPLIPCPTILMEEQFSPLESL